MTRIILIFMMMLFTFTHIVAKEGCVVVIDSLSRMPLAGASVFNCRGHMVGVTDNDGKIPYVSPKEYPVSVRYLGYNERQALSVDIDTLFLQESALELPELTVETSRHRYLHMLAYVREYSTLTTYTDTVFLFREKSVDYMLPPVGKGRFRGWSTPRTLRSRSYYRFTDSSGLDSVSSECEHHFSWSDRVGIPPVSRMPESIRGKEVAAAVLEGKYSPSETWTKDIDRVTVDVDVLALAAGRRWVPDMKAFLDGEMDFDRFRVRFSYGNVLGDSVAATDLTGFSFNIESYGRGRQMFMFGRGGEPYFVTTYAEVYFIDKEFITLKEAKKWAGISIETSDFGIYEPMEAPALSSDILSLIGRVNTEDREGVRLALSPDKKLAGRRLERISAGEMILRRIKGILGIDRIVGRRKTEKKWREYKKQRIRRNREMYQ